MTTAEDPPRKRFESGERPDKPGMYLALFHGRDGRKEQMHQFGFAGPCLDRCTIATRPICPISKFCLKMPRTRSFAAAQMNRM